MNPSRIYRRLAELPIFTSASFISSHQISLESTVKDHVNNTKRTFIQDVGIPDELPSPNSHPNSSHSKIWFSTPVERSETIVGRLISPSGKRTVLLRETTSTPKKRFVEVWRGDYAEFVLETTSRHGSFYVDATFSSLCFSPNEDALLYTAELNAPEEHPTDPFHKFRFEAQYGEQFIDRRRPALFWLRWWDRASTGAESSGSESTTKSSGSESSGGAEPATKLIQIDPSIEHLPKSLASSYTLEDPPVFSLGQAIFASSEGGGSLLATAYLRTAGDRKLGIAYCVNRPSMIVRLTLPDIPLKKDATEEGRKVGEEERVSINCEDLFSDYPSRSPRIWFPPAQGEETPSPVAIWLSSAVEPHNSCSRLHMVELQGAGSDQVRTIIDSVWEPPFPVDEGGFPGLYVNQLPSNPFLFLDGVLHAACLSNWGSNQDLVVIRLVDDYVPPALPGWVVPPASYAHGSRKHQVFRIMPGGRSCTSLVACDGMNKMVVAASSLTEPGEVMVAEVKDRDIGNIEWHRVTHVEERVHDLVSKLEGEVVDIRGHEPAQTIYVKVSEEENQPMITWPHGGPHSVTVAGFSPEVVAFALCGYTISLPNYRGGLGYGQRWVEELIGKIGSLDVGDVMASAEQMIEDGYSQKGPGMQLFMGGSHGGFLGAHVIGQYPSFFSAAVLRNPFINIPALHASTDTPDRATVECGISYDPRAVLTPEQYKTMYNKSPVQYVHKVTTPVLLRIGGVDQRVPTSQGREYYHLLKANGMGEKVEMLWYPGNGHPLDKLEAARAGWDASLAWFKRYGPAKSS